MSKSAQEINSVRSPQVCGYMKSNVLCGYFFYNIAFHFSKCKVYRITFFEMSLWFIYVVTLCMSHSFLRGGGEGLAGIEFLDRTTKTIRLHAY